MVRHRKRRFKEQTKVWKTSGSLYNLQEVRWPPDLSEKSEVAVSFAANFADTLSTTLSVCQCRVNHRWKSEIRSLAEIEKVNEELLASVPRYSQYTHSLKWQRLILRGNHRPERESVICAKNYVFDFPDIYAGFGGGKLAGFIQLT